MSNIEDFLEEKIPSRWKLIKRVNTLELENETLKNTIKDELYKTFMEKLGEPQEMERLRNDNKALRKKVKTLKELIMEEHKNNGRNGNKNLNIRKKCS